MSHHSRLVKPYLLLFLVQNQWRDTRLPEKELAFSHFAWVLARSLRILGKAWERLIAERILPKTSSVRLLNDRALHLNEALGQFLPSLTYVLSRKMIEGGYVAFRPFTDDADKISQNYEQIVRKLLSPKLSEVIVDIGANIGVHTIWLSRKVGPSGLVIAVEPEPKNFTILNLNQRINNLTNVIPIKVALSSARGKGELLVRRPTLMGQVTTIASKGPLRPSMYTIDFWSLDDVISAADLSQVSAIKIDVEGTELAVVKGADETIRRFGSRLVIEVHGVNNLRAIRPLLKSMNMTILSETIASSRRDEARHFVLAIRNRGNDCRSESVQRNI